MHIQTNLQLLFKEESLDFYKTITSTLNNGGAVTFQLLDAIEFVFSKNFTNEIEFLMHLLRTKSLTQEAMECFFKHMMYDKGTARNFVQWQREKAFL
ncbi:MAG: hypothetical protein FAF04_08420 [Epsilonproteobacteria bacterium]|nr:hypothetical protein [Campylobacterota bacterium]